MAPPSRQREYATVFRRRLDFEIAVGFQGMAEPTLATGRFRCSQALKLSGFGLEDASQQPVRWDLSFETMGEKWLGITIPFVGDPAGEAIVDR